MRWLLPIGFLAVAGLIHTFVPVEWGERDGLVLVISLLGVMVLLSDLIEISFGRIFSPMSHLWCFIIAPGTILHELGHWVACHLVGLEVTEVSLFRPNPETRQLGHVAFKMPAAPARWSVIQGLVVAVAPFFSGTAAMLGLLWLISPNLEYPALELDSLTALTDDAERLYEVLREDFKGADDRLGYAKYLVVYGLLVVGSGAAPSTTDFLIPFRQTARRWLGGVFAAVFLGLLAGLLLQLPAVTRTLVSVLALAATCQLVSLFVSFAIRLKVVALSRLLGRDRRTQAGA